MTLIEFLTARLDEDEANIDGDWSAGDGGLHIISAPMHARLLAEVDAKRRLVEIHRAVDEGIVENGRWDESAKAVVPCRYWHCLECDHDRDYGYLGGGTEGCDTLRLLALPYADHPDYDDAWRP